MHPPIFFDPQFVTNVILGLLLTLAGAFLLLLAGIWSSVGGEWLRRPKPAAYRGLYTIGLIAFVAGWLWQIVGYFRVGSLTW